MMSTNRARIAPTLTFAPAGLVLLMVLVTIVFLSLGAYSFSQLMVNETYLTKLSGRQIQSRYLVDSGIDYARLFLTQDQASIREIGGIYNNPEYFQAITVGSQDNADQAQGRFTLIAPGLDDEGNPGGFRYGLYDESNRLNLNILAFVDTAYSGGGKQLLMSLPGMTEDIAEAILDWMDPDDQTRALGAESNYYAGLNPPYVCKNAPIDTIEELLLVRGVTPQLLFGLDANHNGVVDAEEQSSPDAAAIDPSLLLGWAAYLTLYSKEHNRNAEGLQRVNINAEDLEQLSRDLRSHFDQRMTDFIIGYRQNGPYQGEDEPEPIATGQIDFTQPAQFTFTQVLDLIDATTTIKYDGSDEAIVLESPVNLATLGLMMPIIMDIITTQQGEVIPGRLNIMQCPKMLLAGVPGMTDELLENILYYREFELDDPDGADRNRQFETWLLVEGLVDLQTMRTMFPFITCGGDVYRVEVVGYYDDQMGNSRAEAIIDTTTPLPRILFWRDKSHLQRGYSADLLGTQLQQ